MVSCGHHSSQPPCPTASRVVTRQSGAGRAVDLLGGLAGDEHGRVRADIDGDRRTVAGDQAAADIDQGRHRQVAGLVAREQGAQRRALVEPGQPSAAVARGAKRELDRRRRHAGRTPPGASR